MIGRERARADDDDDDQTKLERQKYKKKTKYTKTQRQIHTHKYRKIPNTQSQKDRGCFDTCGSPVALLFPKIWTEIQKKGKKSRNPEIQKPKKSNFFVNL